MATPDKFLTKQEVKKLFAVIKSSRDRALFRVVYFQGLRASEVGRLQLSSFDANEGRLMVKRLKGSLPSNAEILAEELKYLKAWIRDRGPAPGPLFPSNRKKGIGRAQVFVLMRKYCAEAGIPLEKAHPHALKHSLGTNLLQSGVPVELVQKILGHKKITSTMVYLHIANSEVDAAARTFAEGFSA